MVFNPLEIADTIEKEAQKKYEQRSLALDIDKYVPSIYLEIVEFFKEQQEPFPHLEAYEVYQLVEGNLSTDKPNRTEVRGVLNQLLDMPPS